MVRREATMRLIIEGRSDSNSGFDDMCGLLRSLGFQERTRGSHHIFGRAGVEELVNLQRDGAKAKTYQVRQARSIVNCNLGYET